MELHARNYDSNASSSSDEEQWNKSLPLEKGTLKTKSIDGLCAPSGCENHRNHSNSLTAKKIACTANEIHRRNHSAPPQPRRGWLVARLAEVGTPPHPGQDSSTSLQNRDRNDAISAGDNHR